MALSIDVLGVPALERDGEPAAVRGHKVWGLLAYLLLTDAPPSRHQLAGLLFGEADDPVGALRWNLSQLRQALGPGVELGGDPVTLTLPADTTVDAHVLTRGGWVEALDLPGLGQDLLEGLGFAAAPGFELWLASERRRLNGAAAAVLHEAALNRLARSEAAEAAGYAARLVALDQFDENAHVVLVRCLRAAGDFAGAERQVDACTELFTRELGVAPSSALRDAAAAAASGEPGTVGRAAVLAHLDAGEAAIRAGALDAGLAALRRAVVGARAADEPDLLARVLVALGGALVHAARGSDVDGAAALHEAVALAAKSGERSLAATAQRELGYIDFLRGRYDRARESLRAAAELAEGDDVALGWVEVIAGAAHSDAGEYGRAEELLRRGIERTGTAGDRRGAAYGSAFLGRLHLLRGETGEARHTLNDALDVARDDAWAAFLPWPEALLAEVHLGGDELDAAQAALEHALVLGEQLGDPCWVSLSTRGLGLLAARRGEHGDAIALLDEAPRACRRLPDAYLWVEAYALDALCGLAVEQAPQSARRWVAQMEELVSRTGMRELQVRSALHRARLGEPGAGELAAALAAPVDNPLLHESVAALRA
ncbi:MAG TPA: BTAD domain-containing putative transcriptional regulator [Egibacteraceae bacterium]|nr:BTAD domain-containing putative transcriptional regulator [Egibacteraceae bacterium]